ncbi:MAG: archaemetzincin family Zn-dependent metalloprotease [Acidobacteriia bacterium]|nr:archaemetzincin family Zn-dependent metalloprotease [Terriglobia bacterium]
MKYLYVGGMAEVDGEALESIRGRVAAEFALSPREIRLPAPGFAYDPIRGQYASTELLENLVRRCPPDAFKLLAVTECDLFIPVLTFVYGHAQLGGRVALVSLARLRQEFYGLPPNREVFVERALKEALHETGHTFGLVHCADRNCAMALSTNVRQIDSKRAEFCAACAARLPRPARPRE